MNPYDKISEDLFPEPPEFDLLLPGEDTKPFQIDVKNETNTELDVKMDSDLQQSAASCKEGLPMTTRNTISKPNKESDQIDELYPGSPDFDILLSDQNAELSLNDEEPDFTNEIKAKAATDSQDASSFKKKLMKLVTEEDKSDNENDSRKKDELVPEPPEFNIRIPEQMPQQSSPGVEISSDTKASVGKSTQITSERGYINLNTQTKQGNTSSNSTEDDDPVVARYPVYLSNKLSKYLQLFQYPLKSADWSMQQEQTPSSVKIKSTSEIIELDTPIQTSHSMYSRDKGLSLASGMPHTYGQNAGRLFDTQTWTSSPVKQKVKHAIGIFLNGELHITPVNKVSQFRYNLDYIDRINQKKLDATKKDALQEEDTLAETNAKAKTVQIKVRSLQAEEALKKQENSITKIRQRIQEEPWTELEYFDFESEESNAVFTQLFATQKDKLELNTSTSDYLDAISPLSQLKKL